jgi:hypothetical protein
MATEPIAAAQRRKQVVGKISSLFFIAIAMQTVAFLAPSWAYHFAANALLQALSTSSGIPSPAIALVTALVLIALDLFLALVVGFFGARWLYRHIVRATPKTMKPPVRPVPFASVCAGAVVVTVSIISIVSQPRVGGAAAWGFVLFREAAVFALLWHAALRAVRPKTR